MTLLYLVRHGETDWNREGRWQGHYDRSLSPAGRAQATAAARRLAREQISQIHASNLKRAAETAHIIGQTHELDVHLDRALREVDVGDWAGLTHAEAKERFPEGYARRRAGGTGWSGGESYEQMAERVREYVSRLLDSARSSERIALICHSGVIRVLVMHALGLTPSHRRSLGGNQHGALSVLRVRKGAWSLRI
jgi:probable phosphoglycerate mutase